MPPKANNSAFVKHSKYYFKDGNIVFLVDNTLFRVYGGLFGLWFTEPRETSGAHDGDPIRVKDVTASAFALFINWLVAHSFAVDVQGRDALDFTELKPVFQLALQFHMDDVAKSVATEMASSKLKDSEVARSLSLATENTSIFAIGYRDSLFRQLCERESCLTDQEAEMLGARLTASIGRWRMKLNSRAISESAAFMPYGEGATCIDKSPKFEEVWNASQNSGYWKIAAV